MYYAKSAAEYERIKTRCLED
ncbi:hypothetical protein GQ600_6435 [Phytophthora cactorum]|nr:hypothetical protein GQ600_6435 [Phytophthora cactorum]